MLLTLLRCLDVLVLALALPLFLIAGLPLLGYAVAAAAWLTQRGIQLLATGKARELGYAVAAAAWLTQRGIQLLATGKARDSDDPRTIVGVLAGSMIGRGWLVAGSIFAAGMLGERQDGLAAALLAIALFTVYFSAGMVTRPFATAPARPARDGAGGPEGRR